MHHRNCPSSFAGAALAMGGMLLLFLGIDIGILPMGRFIGAELPKRGSIVLIVAVAFSVEFATTVAEPDVLGLAIGWMLPHEAEFQARWCFM
jgi:hypothetical protein